MTFVLYLQSFFLFLFYVSVLYLLVKVKVFLNQSYNFKYRYINELALWHCIVVSSQIDTNVT